MYRTMGNIFKVGFTHRLYPSSGIIAHQASGGAGVVLMVTLSFIWILLRNFDDGMEMC